MSERKKSFPVIKCNGLRLSARCTSPDNQKPARNFVVVLFYFFLLMLSSALARSVTF